MPFVICRQSRNGRVSILISKGFMYVLFNIKYIYLTGVCVDAECTRAC